MSASMPTPEQVFGVKDTQLSLGGRVIARRALLELADGVVCVAAQAVDLAGNVRAKGLPSLKNAKKLVVCLSLREGSGYEMKNGQPVPVDGTAPHFVERLDRPDVDAAALTAQGVELLYITERGVFALENGKLVLIEVMPLMHPYFSVLIHLPGDVPAHRRLRAMPPFVYAPPAEAKE